MSEFIKRIFGTGKKKKLGLALGGGGVKGSVHLGALRAFEEEGISFDVVVGTSIGSIVGCLYARGLSWREIEGVILNSSISDVKNLIVSRLSGVGVDGILSSAVGKLDFSDLKIPFAAVAVDLENGEEKVFTEGNLIKSIGASSAIPPYFRAVEIDGRRYVDGAFANIIPCDVARSLGADIVIGIDLSNNRKRSDRSKFFLDEMYPDNGVPVCDPSSKGYEACDVMIAPDMQEYTATSFGAVAEMFDLGYFETKKLMPQIKEIIE